MTSRTACIVIGLALAAGACQKPAPVVPMAAAINDVPSGDLAGGAQSILAADIPNPLAGDTDANAKGKQLFVQMNCAGCHGYDLGGSMGPNLTDRYWRYGGSPAAIYRSIADGHPQGMPAWRQALTSEQIWQLVTYIQSFGGATQPGDYQTALQGDEPSKASTPAPGGGTGAQSGEKGSSSPAAQPPNP